MTREEAIDVLKANYPDACFGQLRDAVDTAISALEQPEIIRCKDIECVGDCNMCSHENALPEDTDFIKLPSGVYVNKPMQSYMLTWIPCKDNLPEEIGYYLVTLVKDAEVDIAYFTKYHTWETFRNSEVIAWMDLPKPYKEY